MHSNETKTSTGSIQWASNRRHRLIMTALHVVTTADISQESSKSMDRVYDIYMGPKSLLYNIQFRAVLYHTGLVKYQTNFIQLDLDKLLEILQVSTPWPVCTLGGNGSLCLAYFCETNILLSAQFITLYSDELPSLSHCFQFLSLVVESIAGSTEGQIKTILTKLSSNFGAQY